jgi:hypothetical protein
MRRLDFFSSYGIAHEHSSPREHCLVFFGTLLVHEPSLVQFSSDAGLLRIPPSDQRSGHTQAFTDTLDDPR